MRLLGLAIPGAVPVVPAVILAQTLVELLCELLYVWLLPRLGRTRPAARRIRHPPGT